jgi:hypothetical protein
VRHPFESPNHLRRLGYAVLGLGAALGATGTLLRDTGDGAAWTYVLDALAWLLAVAAAVAEARVGAIFSAFQPEPARRRASILFCLGILAALSACVLLSTLDQDGAAVAIRTAAAALLISGIGAGLGGGLALAVTAGARYAADRLAKLDDT